MNILFLHPNFPAQFRHLAFLLAKNPRNRVFFGTARQEGALPGVRKIIYRPDTQSVPEAHPYLQDFGKAVSHGSAIFRMADELRKEKFVPDIVYGASGWGPTMFIRDIYPYAQNLGYFEWFYRERGSNMDFDPDLKPTRGTGPRTRLRNSPILIDLFSCDRGLSPTHWQRQQFPPEFRGKMTVIHDGIDTNYFLPVPGAKLVLPSVKLELSRQDELITYVARGMEPYRGFPQFMEAAALLLERRPKAHVVVVGSDGVFYGPRLPEGRTFKQMMLEKLSLDPVRVHFTGPLPYHDYLRVLQASSVHVYLTYPFVLSWSMLEAMSTGCLLVASNTAPVTEVVRDGLNGLLVDFFSPREIADRVEEALDKPERMRSIRERARRTIVANYDLATLMPRHVRWLTGANGEPHN